MSAYINNLPVELLFEIFEKLLEPPDSPFVVAKSDTIPFVLLLVCRGWRLTALSIPSLWTFVGAPAYNPGNRSKIEFKLQAATMSGFIRQWLSFSKKSPLHLQHHQPSAQNKIVPSSAGLEHCAAKHAELIFRTFALYHKRWESLDILLDGHLAFAFGKICYFELPHLAPRLRSLKMEFLKTCYSVPLDMLFGWVSGLPSLENLEILDECDSVREHLYRIPQIKKLTYIRKFNACLPYRFSVFLLLECPAAMDVSLTGFNRSSQRGRVPRMLLPRAEAKSHRPCLTRLELCNITRPIDVLRFFTLPNLQDLEISGGLMAYQSGTIPTALTTFLHCSKCPLRRLVLYDFQNWIQPEEAIELLKSPLLCNVKEVCIAFEDLRESMVRLLSGRREDLSAGSLEKLLQGAHFVVWRDRLHHYWVGWKTLQREDWPDFSSRNCKASRYTQKGIEW